MTVMIAEVYDALRSAGADDERSRRAAEAVAEWKAESQGLRTEFAELRAEVRKEIGELRAELRTEVHKLQLESEKMRGELAVLRWMIGAMIVLNTGIFVRLLFS